MASANTFPHVIEAATIADMASIHVAELNFGAICFVISENADFTLTPTPSSPPDGVTVVAPAPGAAVGKPGAAWQKGGGGGGGTEFLEGVTLAVLATIHGNDANTLIFVFDTEALYRWSPGGASTADGWTIVNAPGGQWLVQGDALTLSPLGGTSDDWQRLWGAGGAGPATAAAGFKLKLRPGTWRCDTVQQLPRHLVVEFDPGVTIVSTLPSTHGAGHQNSVLAYDGFISPLGATTPSSTIPAGSITFNIVGLMGVASVGDLVNAEILIEDQVANQINQQQSFIIRAASGAGPFTITVDRPTLHVFTAAASVTRGTLALGIKLHGNNTLITGTGDRPISLVAAWQSFAEDFVLDGPGFDAEYTMSFDTGSFKSGYERIYVLSSPATALALEACDGCWMADCYAEFKDPARSNAGALCQAAYNTEIRNIHVSGRTGTQGAGLLIGFINDVAGSEGVKVIGGSFNENLIGIDIRGGSNNVDIIGVDCSYNQSHGVRVLAEDGPPAQEPSKIRILGGHFKNNGQGGTGFALLVDGVKGVRAIGWYTEENASGAAMVQDTRAAPLGGELFVDDAEHLESNNIGNKAVYQCVGTGSVLRVENTKIIDLNIGANLFILTLGELTLRGLRLDTPNNATSAVTQFSGKLYVDDVLVTSAAIGTGIVSVGGTCRRGPNANFSNCTTPFNFAGGQPSFGQVVLNGAGTAQSFAFTDAKATDLLGQTRRVSAGAPAHYTVAPNAGVGITVQGAAGDTSTIEFFTH